MTTLRTSVAALGIVCVALLACKEEKADGCSADSDCKGDRICQAGACVEPAKKETAAAAAAPAPAPAPAAAPTPAPETASSDIHELGPNGLPKNIPAPGSKPPSVAEWQEVKREVTVRGSSALKCETWMRREWLKVNCHKNSMGKPVDVSMNKPTGVQAYKSARPGNLTSVVVQVVHRKRFTATYTWDAGSKTLVVDWPNGAPQPNMYFQ